MCGLVGQYQVGSLDRRGSTTAGAIRRGTRPGTYDSPGAMGHVCEVNVSLLGVWNPRCKGRVKVTCPPRELKAQVG